MSQQETYKKSRAHVAPAYVSLALSTFCVLAYATKLWSWNAVDSPDLSLGTFHPSSNVTAQFPPLCLANAGRYDVTGAVILTTTQCSPWTSALC